MSLVISNVEHHFMCLLAHLVYIKSPLEYVWYLTQCKCYVNSCKNMANLGFAFVKFLEFFSNIFNSTFSRIQLYLI